MEGDENMKRFLALVTMLITLVNFGSITSAMGGSADPTIQTHGLVVKNWKGEYIGSSKHVVLDSSTGNIVFIIVSLGQEEKKEIVVPPGVFSVDEKNGVLILNVSKRDLAAAPEYRDSDLSDPNFLEKVYRYFGLVPSWTDETPLTGT
jgi:hypothetical protein